MLLLCQSIKLPQFPTIYHLACFVLTGTSLKLHMMFTMRSPLIPMVLLMACSPALALNTYTVQAGDTLTRIAKKLGLTPDALQSANPKLKNIHNLTIGQKLNVPSQTQRPPNPAAQTVRTGLQKNTWVWPVSGKITSNYGNRSLAVAGSTFHGGIDISARTGTPVKASQAGTVTYARFDSSGFGNTILIDHGAGWKTRYSHNSQLLVKEGQAVIAGQTIALVGATGFVTGSHLDFRLLFNNTEINPLKIMMPQ